MEGCKGFLKYLKDNREICLSFLRCIVSCTLASINQWIREKRVIPYLLMAAYMQNAETQEKLKDEESTAKSSDSGD